MPKIGNVEVSASPVSFCRCTARCIKCQKEVASEEVAVAKERNAIEIFKHFIPKYCSYCGAKLTEE